MTDSKDSMSPPLDAAEIVVIDGVDVGTTISSEEPLKLPENENVEGPLPSFPSVTMYVDVTTAPFSNFLPIMPSPKRSSYFSS